MGKHHVSICGKGNGTQGDLFSSALNSDRGGPAHSDNSSHAFTAQPMGPGGSDASQTAQAVSSPTFYVGSVGRVDLQTAQAVVRGDRKNVRVRVLFDGGSHRSFITTRAVQMAGVQIKGNWNGLKSARLVSKQRIVVRGRYMS